MLHHSIGKLHLLHGHGPLLHRHGAAVWNRLHDVRVRKSARRHPGKRLYRRVARHHVMHVLLLENLRHGVAAAGQVGLAGVGADNRLVLMRATERVAFGSSPAIDCGDKHCVSAPCCYGARLMHQCCILWGVLRFCTGGACPCPYDSMVENMVRSQCASWLHSLDDQCMPSFDLAPPAHHADSLPCRGTPTSHKVQVRPCDQPTNKAAYVESPAAWPFLPGPSWFGQEVQRPHHRFWQISPERVAGCPPVSCDTCT